MEITMKEKDAISESLRAYVAKYPSQTKAAGSLKGVSVGTVSNILNGRYENISDEMFRNVASQVEHDTIRIYNIFIQFIQIEMIAVTLYSLVMTGITIYRPSLHHQ